MFTARAAPHVAGNSKTDILDRLGSEIYLKTWEVPRIPTAKLEKKKNGIFPQFRQKRIGSYNSDE
jgi:hypothetical protein